MEQTNHVQLNLWAGEDRILREDFNADNVKTEAALAEVAEVQRTMEAVLNAGNLCKFHTMTYEGTDPGVPRNPLSLIFPKKPLVILIADLTGGGSSIFVRGDSGSSGASQTWDGNTFTYSCSFSNNQMTENGHTYQVIALMTDQA